MNSRATRISNPAITKATGKTWEEWHLLLAETATALPDHKALVAYIQATYSLSAWWCQTIAMSVEQWQRHRIVGQTADAGFQIGIRSTFFAPQAELWEYLLSAAGRAIWLGEGVAEPLTLRQTYTTKAGASGTIKVLNPPHHLRLTWHPREWLLPSTVQIRLIAGTGEKTSVRIHQEHLSDAQQRNEMRTHWADVLAAITTAFS